MTNGERQKRLAEMRELAAFYRDEDVSDDYPGISEELTWAAEEIQRLAARVNALEHIINLDMYEATKTALVQAQDEIERLAALAQPDAEPVAWQYRWKMNLFDGGRAWSPWHDLPHGCVERYAELPDYETRALYTAPPRPDTSVGLIEAGTRNIWSFVNV